jgi:hypothetical protein
MPMSALYMLGYKQYVAPEAIRLLSLFSPEAWLPSAWQMRAGRECVGNAADVTRLPRNLFG